MAKQYDAQQVLKKIFNMKEFDDEQNDDIKPSDPLDNDESDSYLDNSSQSELEQDSELISLQDAQMLSMVLVWENEECLGHKEDFFKVVLEQEGIVLNYQ